MNIKYKTYLSYFSDTCITKCPNNAINKDKEPVMVYSVDCGKCNFYKRKLFFKNEIICNFDKRRGIK